MEIQALGSSTVKVSTKKTSITINDDPLVLGKSHVKDGDISVYSNKTSNNADKKTRLFISSAGEYEVADVLITGIPAFPFKEDSDHKLSSTIYKLTSDDASIAVIGNISSELTDSQVEELGHIDALIVPIGGNDATLNSTQALKIIKKIDPFVVIPVHYEDGVTKYGYKQDTLGEAIKIFGLEIVEKTNKYKLKSSNFIEGQAIKLVVLEP